MAVSDYNTNPDLNTAISGVDIGEGAAASGFNNALRQIMADIATWTDGGLASLGGLADDYARLIVVSKSANWAAVDAESGYAYNFVGPASAFTLAPFATTPITQGTTYVIRNAGSGPVTVTRGAGVILWKNGGTTSADAVIGIGGIATITYWGSDYWSITGSNIS